tara:strand:- start:16797 stop:17375 length:579 start_codon:yes stop_codon:yes gene_type:complete
MNHITTDIGSYGEWCDSSDTHHYHDASLCKALTELFLNRGVLSVADFGCGDASYVRAFASVGISIFAVDGNPHTPRITGGLGEVQNLALPLDTKLNYDVVLSLEVGEHIPPEFEQVFIDNLCNTARQQIVMSWAVEGQVGHGHVNCRNNDYIISELTRRGWIYDDEATSSFRAASSLSWFPNSLLVFEKNYD